MLPEWVERVRGGWKHDGRSRPDFAIVPLEGQESVWDYPRPPRIEPERREVVVRVGDIVVCRSRRGMRVLETASPPTVYLPPGDLDRAVLRPASGRSFCEWKGDAKYWTIALRGVTLDRVGWSYPEPLPGFEPIRGFVSFYPSRVECYVDGVRVRPQPGGFYGGWITPEIVGPFKGDPGTEGW